MKKLLVLSLLIIPALSIHAQDKQVMKKNDAFMIFSAGPSFPSGDFADNTNGAAKTGYNLKLNTGYVFPGNVGIAVQAFYSRYKLDLSFFDESGLAVKADHWQYYGVMAGPMITANATDKLKFDFRFEAGLANVNFPVFRMETLNTGEKWKATLAAALGANLRYNFTPKACLFSSLDYTAMKPKVTIGGVKVEQTIDAIGVDVGIGFNF